MRDLEFFEWIKMGVDNIARRGEIPVSIAFGASNRPNVAVSVPHFEDQDEKVNSFTAAFAVLRGLGATNLGIVLDCYYLVLPEDTDLDNLPLPSQSSDRREAIVVYTNEHFGIKRYSRNDDGTVEWEDWDKDQGVQESWIIEKMAEVLALPDPGPGGQALIQDLMRAYEIKVFPIG